MGFEGGAWADDQPTSERSQGERRGGQERSRHEQEGQVRIASQRTSCEEPVFAEYRHSVDEQKGDIEDGSEAQHGRPRIRR